MILFFHSNKILFNGFGYLIQTAEKSLTVEFYTVLYYQLTLWQHYEKEDKTILYRGLGREGRLTFLGDAWNDPWGWGRELVRWSSGTSPSPASVRIAPSGLCPALSFVPWKGFQVVLAILLSSSSPLCHVSLLPMLILTLRIWLELLTAGTAPFTLQHLPKLSARRKVSPPLQSSL